MKSITLKQILEAIEVKDVEEMFKNVPKEYSDRIKKEFYKKNGKLDKKANISLTIINNENLDKTKFKALMYILKTLDSNTVQEIRNPTYKEMKKLYNAQKSRPAKNKKEEKPITRIKSKDMGQEVLFFPNTYEQLKAFSSWMASKDPEVSVNHWCVSSSDENYFKGYAEDGGRFLVIVKKKDGKPDWTKRYLFYSRPVSAKKDDGSVVVDDDDDDLDEIMGDEGSRIELANKENDHLNIREAKSIFSKLTVDFMNNYDLLGQKRKIKNLEIPKKKKEEKNFKEVSGQFDGKNLRISFGDKKSVKKLYEKMEEDGVTHLDTVTIEDVDKLWNYSDLNFIKTVNNIVVEDMDRSFWVKNMLPNLTSIGTLEIKKSSLKKLDYIFADLKRLKSVGKLIIPGNINTLTYLFGNCYNLEKLPTINTKNISFFNHTFADLAKVKSLPSYKMDSFISGTKMFRQTNGVTHLDMSDSSAWIFRFVKKEVDIFENLNLDEATRKELQRRNPNIKFYFGDEKKKSEPLKINISKNRF